MATSALTTKSEQQSPQHQTPTKASPSSSTATSSNLQQSPRNTANVLPSTGTYVSFGPVEVSKALQDGEKFVKWDEESTSGTPVTMRVDPKGFYLCWVDQNNELDILDIATIRDVRNGQYAKKPRHWTEELMKLAYSLSQLNGSTTNFLQKAHTKLCMQVDKAGKISVKNIIKQFASNKDDKRRVEKALDVSGLPSGKSDSLPQNKFQFEDFYNLYKNLTQRTEVEKIFEELVGSSSKRCTMSTQQLVDFLNKTQRDPRLNEILYPYANPARAKELIAQYEPNKFNVQKGQLSLDGFLRYLMSDDNPVMAASKLDLCDDMEQPLSHYFINSSHNTYLTGHQLTGKSSVEIYRQFASWMQIQTPDAIRTSLLSEHNIRFTYRKLFKHLRQTTELVSQSDRLAQQNFDLGYSSAQWCGPCKLLAPRIENIVGASDDKIHLAKIDVDNLDSIAAQYQVSSIPSVFAVKNGKIVDQFVGLRDEDQIQSFVDKLLVKN